MGLITYLTGDATSPQGEGNKIIAHIVNDIGAWGAGFVLSVSRRWDEPERQYRAWYADREASNFALGAVQLVKVKCKPDIQFVANMCAQSGIRGNGREPPIRYEALAKCLQTLGERATSVQASIHMPRIGTGLAGGRWSEIEPLLDLHLSSNDVFVYDWKP